MRRYIESAGQHFGVAGYVINIDENDSDDPGAVFGQAWLVERGRLRTVVVAVVVITVNYRK